MDIGALVAHIVRDRTVRLVATARLRDPVLLKLVGNEDLDALAEIEGATSGRLRAEQFGTDSLDRRELVFGIPHARFINAAFCYWTPRALNRFNRPGRGAWYAAFDTVIGRRSTSAFYPLRGLRSAENDRCTEMRSDNT